MSQATHPVYPCTLLGIARAALASAEDVQGQRLKAYAASRLGYHQQARGIWETLAHGGDVEAAYQLERMAGQGLRK